MVTIGMNYRVISGKESAFVQMFNKVLEVMKTIDGHHHSALYADVNEPCSFLIVSEWTQKAAFDDFIRSEKFTAVVTWGREKILAERPRHQVYGDQHDAPGARPAHTPS